MGARRSVVLLATGAHLPGEPIDNDTLARVAGSLPDDVLEGIQVKDAPLDRRSAHRRAV